MAAVGGDDDVSRGKKGGSAHATALDRDYMLRQIEALKVARQEAEHLRQENQRMQARRAG